MMVNKGLGSPSQRGGPDKLLMSPSGRDREFKLTLLVYDAGQRHIAERRATRLSSASTNGVIANSSANPPGLRRRATNAACPAAVRARQSGAPTRPATGTRWRLWRRGISPQRRREEKVCVADCGNQRKACLQPTLFGCPRSGNRRSLPRLAPLLEALQYRKERGDEQHREAGRGDDAAQYAQTQRYAADGSGAGGQHERHDPEAEGERGHQDRAEPKTRGVDCRFADRLAVNE